MIDTVFHWRTEQRIRHIDKPHCRLRIFERTEATIVIATQLSTSTSSISQDVECLATLVQKCFKIYPDHLIWIEHFDPQSSLLSSYKEDQYHLVILGWNERCQKYTKDVHWFKISSFVLSPLLRPGVVDEELLPAHELQPLWNEAANAKEKARSNPDRWSLVRFIWSRIF